MAPPLKTKPDPRAMVWPPPHTWAEPREASTVALPPGIKSETLDPGSGIAPAVIPAEVIASPTLEAI